MLNSPGNHGHSLGLSVGATNLAGTRDGHTAVIRPAELTLHGQRLTGFVDRVGDPVPLVAPDGSKYRSEELLADALGAMAHAVTDGMPGLRRRRHRARALARVGRRHPAQESARRAAG